MASLLARVYKGKAEKKYPKEFWCKTSDHIGNSHGTTCDVSGRLCLAGKLSHMKSHHHIGASIIYKMALSPCPYALALNIDATSGLVLLLYV